MRLFAFLVLLSLILSFACSQEAPSTPSSLTNIRLPHPGILEGRPDPAEEKYFLKRYNGFLGNGDSIPIDLLLINWGNGRLSGHTYYPDHSGILKFEGKLEPDGHFELVEEKDEKRNASFVGQFHGSDSLSGTWWNIDSSQTMPFYYKEFVSLHDPDLWTGAWHLNDPWDTATLIIGGVTEKKLQFALTIYINDYTEEFYGTADIKGQRAVMDLLMFRHYHENCRVVFYRRDREIFLDQESFPFLCGLGANCWTTGIYKDIYSGQKARMDFIGKDSVFVDTATYQVFLDLVGPAVQNKFAYNMERLEKHAVKDTADNIFGTYWKGRVRGFHREKEGIIAYDTSKNMWAATTTAPDTFLGPMQVHYYSNVPKWKKRMPEMISTWMEKFYDASVVYESK